MSKLSGVLIDTEKRIARSVTIEDELDEFYKILNCSTIDIVQRRIGSGRSKKSFSIVCDDEGTFVEDPKISAINNLGSGMLVGNLFITGLSDDEGNLLSLAPEDLNYILRRCQKMPTRKHPEGLMILTQCEY